MKRRERERARATERPHRILSHVDPQSGRHNLQGQGNFRDEGDGYVSERERETEMTSDMHLSLSLHTHTHTHTHP